MPHPRWQGNLWIDTNAGEVIAECKTAVDTQVENCSLPNEFLTVCVTEKNVIEFQKILFLGQFFGDRS